MSDPAANSELQYDAVILGGGFAGVYCARSLARQLGPDAAKRVALISNENFMVFQPMLAEVVGSAISPRHVVNPLRLLCRDITVLRANIRGIDLENCRLHLEAGDFTGPVSVGFQHLVLTLGGIVDLSRVPGMPEHALLMKNVGDALKLRGAILDRFEEANTLVDAAERKRLLTFVIVGGGYSGVETAGQILDLALEIVHFYSRISADEPQVVLVHSGSHLLPEISESLGRYTEENLRNRGVELILNARVTAMTASRVKLNDGRTIDSHTVVSTVGNAPHPLIADLCKKGSITSEKSRIITDTSMRVPGHPRLWAAGDCAAVPMHSAKTSQASAGGKSPMMPSPFKPQSYCPPTAQFAVRQGTLLGKNVAGALQNGRCDRPFTFTGLGELAAIGHHSAVAEIMGCKFHGFIAWWLWRSIYLAKLPGLERKLRVMIDWTLDLFFPRDITLFQARPTELLKEMHLEPGDHVFHAGDPALSLYIVKTGRLELRDDDGKVLRTVTPGMQIGKQTLVTSKVWRFSALAVESSALVMVSGKVFETVVNAGSSAEEAFAHPAPSLTPASIPAAASEPASLAR